MWIIDSTGLRIPCQRNLNSRFISKPRISGSTSKNFSDSRSWISLHMPISTCFFFFNFCFALHHDNHCLQLILNNCQRKCLIIRVKTNIKTYLFILTRTSQCSIQQQYINYQVVVAVVVVVVVVVYRLSNHISSGCYRFNFQGSSFQYNQQDFYRNFSVIQIRHSYH